MAQAARVTRASSQHAQLRRRARDLTAEVERLSIPEALPERDLRLVAPPEPQMLNVDAFLDRAIDLTKGWEKIASLVALITTNLSGNKSMGVLLDIVAKDKVLPPSSSGAGQPGQTPGAGLNISELLAMAEGILRTGQLPPALQALAPSPHQPGETMGEIIESPATGSADVLDEPTVPSPEHHMAEAEEPGAAGVPEEPPLEFVPGEPPEDPDALG